MPFVYGVVPGVDFTTSGTPGTEIDAIFIRPGTRTMALQALYATGKAPALTAISGIIQRVKKYSATAASGGSAVVPTPRDPGAQAAKASSGQATAGVVAGSGGPSLVLAIGHGAGGQGGWVAPNADSMPVLEAAATQSLDIFNSSNTASLKFELSLEIVE